MNKRDVSLTLARRTGLTQAEAKRLTNELFLLLTEVISSGESVKISGFGTFVLRPKARSSFCRRIVFRPGKPLKDCTERREGRDAHSDAAI